MQSCLICFLLLQCICCLLLDLNYETYLAFPPLKPTNTHTLHFSLVAVKRPPRVCEFLLPDGSSKSAAAPRPEPNITRSAPLMDRKLALMRLPVGLRECVLNGGIAR